MTVNHSELCWSVVQWKCKPGQWLSSAKFSLGMSQRLSVYIVTMIAMARCLPPTPRSLIYREQYTCIIINPCWQLQGYSLHCSSLLIILCPLAI
jgi:hypothetical protein